MKKNKIFLFFKNFRRVLHAFIFSFSIFGNPMECVSIKALQPYLDQLQPGDWVVVDIDDTIITPIAMMFRTQSPHCKLIDKLKTLPNSNTIVSAWRLNRKVMLVEKEWPEIIESLKKRGVTVIALTQMHTGAFGSIPSMEKWRFEELNFLGITFSPYATDHVETLIDSKMPATLYKGILFTGSHTKVDTFKSFAAKYGTPAKLVFFDDRFEHVIALKEFCFNMNISFEGYLYQAVNQLPYNTEKDFGTIQSQKLQNDGIWVEDAQIQEMS